MTQKNTLLQAATSNAETKARKRVFFSPTQVKLFFKISPTSKNFLKPNRTVQTRHDSASNVNHFGESLCKIRRTPLWTDSKPAGNRVGGSARD